MLGALVEVVVDAFVSVLGMAPERQPWRAIVMVLYMLGALFGIAVIVWAIVAAV